ncbi:hypothetical protein RIF29_29509 [Crotalaria pallida]|uniref:Uncharacterized protein n=1 Tax=Crotalaria pallida TaxID=3830 RepID=A0AAN9HXJ0_CROPI
MKLRYYSDAVHGADHNYYSGGADHRAAQGNNGDADYYSDAVHGGRERRCIYTSRVHDSTQCRAKPFHSLRSFALHMWGSKCTGALVELTYYYRYYSDAVHGADHNYYSGGAHHRAAQGNNGDADYYSDAVHGGRERRRVHDNTQCRAKPFHSLRSFALHLWGSKCTGALVELTYYYRYYSDAVHGVDHNYYSGGADHRAAQGNNGDADYYSDAVHGGRERRIFGRQAFGAYGADGIIMCSVMIAAEH